MTAYEKLNSIVFDKWMNDDRTFDDIYSELFMYKVLDNTMRWILGMDDEKITKKAILEIAEHFTNDKDTIEEARELSGCFVEEE